MEILNTLFISRNNGELELYDPNNQNQLKISLSKPWVYFPFSKVSYLTHIRIIDPFQISQSEYETTPDTLIIINPDILISARMIASAQTCPRQSYLQFIQGESKPSLPMIRGLIVHDAYGLIVSQDDSVKKAIIKVQPGIDESKIVLAATLKEDLEIDSLSRVEMTLALEDAFNFYLQDEELEDIKTVGDVVDLIESKVKVKNA